MSDQGGTEIGVDALLELTGTLREARAYAFLYAAFRKTEISNNPVRDAVDCLTPFITPYLNTIANQRIRLDDVHTYLKSNFGFDIPLYAIDQLISGLGKAEYAEYSHAAKAYIAKANTTTFGVAKADIETDFDDVVAELTEFAKELGYTSAPPAGSWADAMIAFLRNSTEGPTVRTMKVHGALIDPGKAQFSVIGSFIRRLHARNPAAFNKLLKIFMGILVEEFISSVSEVKISDEKTDSIVFYDTAVLLRLLGTSGKLMRSATEELTRYLQDLGFSIYYLEGNESEVSNIFNTIVFLKDSGKELEGETAEAISAGEVSITSIRMLQNTFTERLAALNVFPADNLPAFSADLARYQIDEKGFEAHLLKQANASNRAYSAQNREHDAKYLGTVMRIRAGRKTRDLMNCGYVFVTTNRFLAQTSRRFLIEQRILSPQQCAPIMSAGQVATIAWLMKDQKLVPEKAGRELLSNCFAAVRPDAEWFKYFREGIESATGSIEEYGKAPGNSLVLQAARRIAQEESFGSTALVRELNMAEILSRAEAEKEEMAVEQAAEMEAVRAQGAEERERILADAAAAAADQAEAMKIQREIAEKERMDAIRTTKEEADRLTETLVRDAKMSVARRQAKAIIWMVRGLLVLSFVTVTSWGLFLKITKADNVGVYIAAAVLAAISVFSFFNLLGVPLVKDWIQRLEDRITSALAK